MNNNDRDKEILDLINQLQHLQAQQYAIASRLATVSGTTGTTQIPAAKWVRIDWAQHLTTASAIDGVPLWQGLASFFVPGKSELFPFDVATIASYQGQLKQNPGY